jgi:hypothetical protein
MMGICSCCRAILRYLALCLLCRPLACTSLPSLRRRHRVIDSDPTCSTLCLQPLRAFVLVPRGVLELPLDNTCEDCAGPRAGLRCFEDADDLTALRTSLS